MQVYIVGYEVSELVWVQVFLHWGLCSYIYLLKLTSR